MRLTLPLLILISFGVLCRSHKENPDHNSFLENAEQDNEVEQQSDTWGLFLHPKSKLMQLKGLILLLEKYGKDNYLKYNSEEKEKKSLPSEESNNASNQKVVTVPAEKTVQTSNPPDIGIGNMMSNLHLRPEGSNYRFTHSMVDGWSY